MPIAPSQYWNIAHGGAPGEAKAGEEEMQTMRTLANNIVFMIKAISLGKKKYGLLQREEQITTSFIR